MIDELKKYYGLQFEKNLLNDIIDVGVLIETPEGEELIKPGQFIRSMPLLLSGSIKIMRVDENGEELLLYHLEKGDTCAMTLSCCMGHTKSEIRAVTETATKLIMIPIGKMEEWASTYKSWRQFVFNSYHSRMMEMLESIDNIAFNNLDERLQNYLNDKIKILNSKHIYTTHKDIAKDLNTSRVVISRLLKKMEINGSIKLHRSFVEVL